VRANAALIRQLIVNLVTNASEALGEQNGVVRLLGGVISLTPDASATASSLPVGDYVKLAVCDTGGGIAKEIRDRIFDPFFTTKFPGRGLGLAAVQGIIRGHGGAINVVSAPGRGTTFEVILPIAGERASIKRDMANAEIRASSPARQTVLLVEDEEGLRLPVSKLLRKRGFDVLEAEDGAAAVALFAAKSQAIGVVLMDLTLPGLSGREVVLELERIRPDLKVVVTTAYSKEAAVALMGGHGDWAFIRKPYNINELAELLRQALSSG
jgi:CheY-like chemotaxis protein